MVKTCIERAKSCRARIEQMQGVPFSTRAWSRVGMYFFYINGKQYLVAIDYYSKDIEVRPVIRGNTPETIDFLKRLFTISTGLQIYLYQTTGRNTRQKNLVVSMSPGHLNMLHLILTTQNRMEKQSVPCNLSKGLCKIVMTFIWT